MVCHCIEACLIALAVLLSINPSVDDNSLDTSVIPMPPELQGSNTFRPPRAGENTMKTKKKEKHVYLLAPERDARCSSSSSGNIWPEILHLKWKLLKLILLRTSMWFSQIRLVNAFA